MSSPSSPDLDGDPPARRRVALLGSTGSIGRQTLDVLARGPRGVPGHRAGRRAGCRDPGRAGGSPASSRGQPRRRCGPRRLDLPLGTERVGGADALEPLAIRDDVDLVIVATGGIVSLRPVLAALRAGKVVATANKETLVAGGHLVMPLARVHAAAVASMAPLDPMASPLAWVRPIDSEHSALWQCLVGEPMDVVAALILTASGGPFRDASPEALAAVTPEQALRPPDLEHGRQDHHRFRDAHEQGPGGHRGTLAVRCRLRRDRGPHPPAEPRALAVRVHRRLPQGPARTPDMRIPIQYALT